jgi:hemolysin III
LKYLCRMMLKPRKNRKIEERYNVITHGMGTILSCVALFLLLQKSVQYADWVTAIAALTFGGSLLLLYAASTFYHAVWRLRHKKIGQRLDHLSIYVLIAGTYTPVVLVGLQGVWGWTLLVLIWTLAIVGFGFKFSRFRHQERISLGLYALMGWICVIAIDPMIERLSREALIGIALGGFFYTAGIYFYANDRKRYYHPIWHLFVLAGSASHFVAIYYFILP